MPIKAVYNGVPIYSFSFDDAEWAALKREYKQGSLLTNCCHQLAIPRVSPLGAKHFVHKIKGPCNSKPESREHLLIKFLIASYAYDLGWEVRTEEPGVSSDGEKWIADVFCQKGSVKIALEVQLSPQSEDITVTRQERYAQSGVRGAWFVKFSPGKISKSAFLMCKDIPMFAVDFSDEEAIKIPHFDLSLKEFVTGMLSGDLKWIPIEQVKVQAEYQCFLIKQHCQKCCHEQDLLMATRFRERGGMWSIPKINTLMQLLLGNAELDAINNNIVDKPYSTNWQQKCSKCRKIMHVSSYGDERQFFDTGLYENNKFSMISSESNISTNRTVGGSWRFKGIQMYLIPERKSWV